MKTERERERERYGQTMNPDNKLQDTFCSKPKCTLKHSLSVRLSTQFEAVTIEANFKDVITVNRKSSLTCVVLFLST
jgi:hypothetical protein